MLGGGGSPHVLVALEERGVESDAAARLVIGVVATAEVSRVADVT